GGHCVMRVKDVQAPFAGGGEVGLNDREVVQSVQGSPTSPGRTLLCLRDSRIQLRGVVGEGNLQVEGESQDHVLVAGEAAKEFAGLVGEQFAPGGVLAPAACDRAV